MNKVNKSLNATNILNDNLNKLFHIFYNNYSGFKFYQVLIDFKSGKETENVKIYRDILKTKDKILASMKEYSDSYSQSITI